MWEKAIITQDSIWSQTKNDVDLNFNDLENMFGAKPLAQPKNNKTDNKTQQVLISLFLD